MAENIDEEKTPVTDNYLKNHYSSQDTLPKFLDDADIPPLSIAKCYVNLSIVKQEAQKDKEDNVGSLDANMLAMEETIYGSKEPIALDKLFDDNKNKLLLYGKAGVGKTTLVQYIKYEWANDKLWKNKFDNIYAVTLRDLTHSWREVIPQKLNDYEPLVQFIFYCCYRKANFAEAINIAEEIQTNLQKNHTLIILDGYDEIGGIATEPIPKAIITQAMSSKNVIMTSRSNAVGADLKSKFDLELENIGLTNENIGEFVRKYYQNSDKAKRVHDFIKQNQILNNMSHIPINLLLICFSFDQLSAAEHKEGITLTSLYTEVVKHLLKRYISKSNKEKTVNLSDREIFEKEEVWILEKIAYDAMCRGQIIIDPKIISNLDIEGHKLTQLEAIGLLKPIGEGIGMRNKDHYFVHLTFQEYFAARYLAKLLHSKDKVLIKEGKTFLQKYKYNPLYERMMWFTAGLVSSNKGQNPQNLANFWEVVAKKEKNIFIRRIVVLMRCLDESKIDKRISGIKEILNEVEKNIKKMIHVKPLQDYLILSPNLYKKLDIFKYLIRNLNPQDNEVGRGVASVLGNIAVGNNEVIRQLISNIFDNKNSLVVHDAKEVLMNEAKEVLSKIAIGNEQAINRLMHIFTNDSEDLVRDNVALVLGNIAIGDKKAIKDLISNFNSCKNDELRLNAALDLKNNNVEDKKTILKRLHTPTNNIGNKKEIKDLNLAFDYYTNNSMRLNAVRVLGRIGIGDKDAIESLISALINDENELVRSNAAEGLGEIAIGDKKAIERLLSALVNNKEKSVRLNAAEALGKIAIEDDETINALINILDECKKDIVKQYCLYVLGKIAIGNPHVIKKCIALANDKNALIRLNAAVALGNIAVKDDEAIEQLLSMLAWDEDKTVKKYAAEALGKIAIGHDKTINNLIFFLALALANDKEDMVKGCIEKTLGKIAIGNDEAIRQLTSDLTKDKDKWVRPETVGILKKIAVGKNEAIDFLIHTISIDILSNDMHRRVRRAAVDALGEIAAKDEKTIKYLINALAHDKDNLLKQYAAEALGKIAIGHNEAIKQLICNLKNRKENSRVRQCAAEALEKIAIIGHGEAIEHLIYNLKKDPDNVVRSYAAEALGKIAKGNKEAVKQLIYTFTYGENYSVRQNVARALFLQENYIVAELSESITINFSSLNFGEYTLIKNKFREGIIPMNYYEKIVHTKDEISPLPHYCETARLFPNAIDEQQQLWISFIQERIQLYERKKLEQTIYRNSNLCEYYNHFRTIISSSHIAAMALRPEAISAKQGVYIHGTNRVIQAANSLSSVAEMIPKVGALASPIIRILAGVVDDHTRNLQIENFLNLFPTPEELGMLLKVLSLKMVLVRQNKLNDFPIEQTNNLINFAKIIYNWIRGKTPPTPAGKLAEEDANLILEAIVNGKIEYKRTGDNDEQNLCKCVLETLGFVEPTELPLSNEVKINSASPNMLPSSSIRFPAYLDKKESYLLDDESISL